MYNMHMSHVLPNVLPKMSWGFVEFNESFIGKVFRAESGSDRKIQQQLSNKQHDDVFVFDIFLAYFKYPNMSEKIFWIQNFFIFT